MNLWSFSLANDSPVKEDSSINKWEELINLISAHTFLPASNNTTSPITTSLASISLMWLFLLTKHFNEVNFDRAFNAFSALSSW